MRLKPMTDFVLQFEQNEAKSPELRNFLKGVDTVVNYAKFLKRPLTIEMFVPCDEAGNVLEEPNEYANWIRAIEIDEFNYFADGWDGCRQYHEAKEKVLFKNCVTYDYTPHYQTKRLMINLNHQSFVRIYNKFEYYNGKIDKDFLPHFSEIPNIEYLVQYDLELTESAIKKIRNYGKDI